MTKKEIARMISAELGLTHQKTQLVVQRTLDLIVEVLATEGQVELRKFGVFKLKERPSRIARNPRTGESIELPERSVIAFKAGKEMEERVELYRSRRKLRSASPLNLNQEEEPPTKPI